MKIRVYYEDTDAGGIVYHANYIKFCERARSEKFFAAKYEFSEQSQFVVSEIKAKFIAPARLGDLLEIRTSVLETRRASVLIRQEIFRVERVGGACEPEPVFGAEILVAHLCNGKPARLKDEFLTFFA